ncbi:MAG: ABC transporter ATP-binding protein [Deltaproteobacteria bacterium]|nr:ABC transporter ATP-binding protein [Candidatus Tharpella sp.]
MSKLLEVNDLSIDLPVPAGTLRAVRNVSFAVDKGETLALVGESGCGKSLTALSLMDLLPRAAKRRARIFRFDDLDLMALGERKMTDIRGRRMSMIFQEPMTSLNPCYTIGNQLEEALLRHQTVSRKQARERAVFLLDKVGITAAGSRLKQYPHQLSGGLRQRIMISMALMCGPSLIIADEPTTALDVTIQAQILALLSSLQDEFEMGMIMITHDLGVVSRVADQVAVMYCGEIIETGSTKALFADPLHPYTKGLLDCIPVPGRTRRGAHLSSIPGTVPTPIGELTGCVFRNRCPEVTAACSEGLIETRNFGENRSCRCLLMQV